jgi:hypothetical protein
MNRQQDINISGPTKYQQTGERQEKKGKIQPLKRQQIEEHSEQHQHV